jgi:hypothetical protein
LGRLHYSVKEYENARALNMLLDRWWIMVLYGKGKAYERLKKYEKPLKITTVQSN